MSKLLIPALPVLLPLSFVVADDSPAEPPDAEPVFVSPPNSDRPTPVMLGLYLIEVTNIDEGSNSFEIEGYLDLKWRDPRLAFDPDEAGVSKKMYLESNARRQLDRIWWPDITFVNEVEPTETENEELIVRPDGRAEVRKKFSAHLASNYRMREFPFDSQALVVEIESFAWNSDDLVFQVADEVVGFSRDFSMPGWQVTGIEETIESIREPRDRAPFSKFVAVIRVERDPGFFVSKLFLPLALVMLLISATLWMSPDQYFNRVNGTLVGLLTSAAYGITITTFLPKHVYNTYLDAVILASLFFSTLLVIIHVVSQHYYVTDRQALSTRIDRTFRWLFPLVYVASLLLLAGIYVW